jgi:radical SAM protein with 4Fe4S-binding SPASM domain
MKKKVRVNHDYFLLNSRFQNIISFLRQGNVIHHLIDRIKWHYAPRFFITTAFPTHLEVEASSACQMRCPMCKTTEMIKKGQIFSGLMDFDLYTRIVDEAVKNKVYSIKLSWRGETLLNPRIPEMVAYAKKKGIKDVAFLSNGERLSPQLTENLVRSGLDWISISADGLGEVYNQIRKPAVFEETYAKVKHLREFRDQKKLTKPLIRVQSVHSAIRGKENEWFSKWESVADRVNIIADQVRSIEEKDYRHDPAFICPSPWQRMCITWDGLVTQCYSDYMQQGVLGDVKQQSLKEIWRGEAFQDLRQKMKSGKRLQTKPCRTCSDGGIFESEEIIIGGRKVMAGHYRDQAVDVKFMESDK